MLQFVRKARMAGISDSSWKYAWCCRQYIRIKVIDPPILYTFHGLISSTQRDISVILLNFRVHNQKFRSSPLNESCKTRRKAAATALANLLCVSICPYEISRSFVKYEIIETRPHEVIPRTVNSILAHSYNGLLSI